MKLSNYLTISKFSFLIVIIGGLSFLTTPIGSGIALLIALIKWELTTFLMVWAIFALTTVPIAMLLSKTKYSKYWPWCDDSMYNDHTLTGLHEDYLLYLVNLTGDYKEGFWPKFNWLAFRNRFYNAVNSLGKTPEGPEENIVRFKDDLTMNGKKIQDCTRIWSVMARLKYIDKYGNEGPQVNRGVKISGRHSIFGEALTFFTRGEFKGFRYSYCKKVKLFLFWERYRTIKLGWNNNRISSSFKHQKVRPIEYTKNDSKTLSEYKIVRRALSNPATLNQ